ncbi:MAG: hypothetical protein CEN88_174 [Candidatus Berkelbacteria bacterium Licking1014_2]|uniref:Uncharacterized protein n=1 Tax=Candidatus Berkelbacteria bacterium Licking1014_2 TaxID=2017146 RepID=A0A554LW64_9BACT|nr:MAG: hypothetical protein CEN88_174 [Candidatus Berkelbacteria bacterium Licking1014_2]
MGKILFYIAWVVIILSGIIIFSYTKNKKPRRQR